MQRLPTSIGDYYEPFVGGGALFFAVRPTSASLSDINFPLMVTYRAIRGYVDKVIDELKIHGHENSRGYFNSVRGDLAKNLDSWELAATFIYLNKTCYNGLYRVNKSGGFNVPYGSYENPTIVDSENLSNCSRALRDVELVHRGFGDTPIKSGAFYYLDPPYHQTYSSYDSSGFGEAEHRQLADFCHEIDRVGGQFMLSNNDTELIRKLYSKYSLDRVEASRAVSCKAGSRGRKNELIITNF